MIKKEIIKYFFILIFITVPVILHSNARVTYLKGECEIKSTDSSDYKKLKLNDKIAENNSIRTAPGSLLQIEFKNKAVVRINSSATFKITSIQDGKVEIFVSGGNLSANFSQTSDEQKLTLLSKTAKTQIKNAAVKFKVEYNKTTIICIKGSIKTGSNMPEWQHIDPVTLGTTDKIVLTNLINQTNAPILVSDENELFIDKELFKKQKIKKIKKEEVNLEEFKKQETVVKKVKKKKESGFRFNGAFGAVQLQRSSYFSLALRPEFYHKDFSIALYIPFYLDGYNRFYYPSKWGNYSEWDFASTQDALGDLLLKIDYIKYGKREDNYFFIIGKLKRFTFGNGAIVRNLNNLESYPLIKRSGLYFNINPGIFGFQGFIADINVADIQGYRMYLKPFHKNTDIKRDLELGFTCVFDANPTETDRKNPALFTIGLDLNIPVSKSENLYSLMKIDIVVYGFRYINDSKQSAANLSDYSDGGLGLNILNASIFQMSLLFNIFKVAEIETGIIYSQEGVMPEWMDAFYFISRTEKASNLLSTQDKGARFGLHASILFKLKKMFKIKVRYLLLSNKSSTSDKIYFSISSIKGALWKFHLRLVYEKLDFYKTALKLMKNCLFTFEVGFIWSDNVQLVGIFRRFYDTSLIDYRTFQLETRLTF